MKKGFLPPVHLANGLALFCADNIRVHLEGHVYDLELEVLDGRLAISRFCVKRQPDGPPITIGLLKSVPLVGLAAAAGRKGLLSGLMRTRPGDTSGETHFEHAGQEDIDKLPELERVALVYRWAHFLGLPPTAQVAKELHMSHAVAAKRVQAARREGLLEPTTKGRKGA